MKINKPWEEEYRKLKKNWDSYGADPPTEEAISTAKKIIARLDDLNIVPSNNGGLSILLIVNNDEYAIDIGPDGKPVYSDEAAYCIECGEVITTTRDKAMHVVCMGVLEPHPDAKDYWDKSVS